MYSNYRKRRYFGHYSVKSGAYYLKFAGGADAVWDRLKWGGVSWDPPKN